jgi:RNA polymerase sigma factor (sigma-70 family)
MAQCPVPDPQAKDRPADEFDRLLRPLIPLLYRQAFRWTAARDQAEDLVQDLLVKIYPRLDELAALDDVQPWALRVMYRIFVDQHRRATNSPVRPAHELPAHGQGELENPWEHAPDESPQPPEQLERELLGRRLAAAWRVLGDDHRVVIAMHDIEGYRLEELAAMLETPVGTLKSRLHRARARLRELLTAEPFADPIRVSKRRGTL